MEYAVDGQQMKALDRYAIEHMGLPSLVLMERAALACVKALERFPLERVLVVCGSGNNGADGVAVARLLHLQGKRVEYFLTGRGSGSEELETQLKIAENCGTTRVQNPDWNSYTTIVDAMIGIGLRQEVRPAQRELIEQINSSAARVLAVDIPSGIHSGNGQVLGDAVRADETVTFGYRKNGMVLYPGASYAGQVTVADIGIYGIEQLPETEILQLLTWQESTWIPPRPRGGNKGTFGKVLLLAGACNMSGAAYLAAKAAFRTGCGMVRIATVPENREILQQMLPEAMLETGSEEAIKGAAAWADVLAAGPGMGQSPESLQKLEILLEASQEKPVVLDGDALNLLARNPRLWELQRSPWIVTPHPGELGRLLGISTQQVLKDFGSCAQKLAVSRGCIAVCKDAATLCVGPSGKKYANNTGNCGMATAGSGDVLTGVIAGLLAQNTEPERAGALGPWIHGKAGDLLAEEGGQAALMAGQLPEAVGRIFQTIEERRQYNGK